MKTKIVLFIAIFLPISVFAQMRVAPNGSVGINSTIYDLSHPLTVGNVKSIYLSPKNSAIISSPILRDSILNIGVDGMVPEDTTLLYPKNVGVRGTVRMRPDNGGKNYGVWGCAFNNYVDGTSGAGIMGSTRFITYLSGPAVSGVYAGYFDGAVRVKGTLTADQIVSSSDIRLKENVNPLGTSSTSGASTLENVIGMNVIEYNYKVESEEEIDSDPNLSASEAQLLKKEAEALRGKSKQTHFGLSAQELKEIYPNLVYEGQDGYLAVNYIELVPVLIRSIQELKAELDELKGEKSEDAKGVRAAGGVSDSESVKSSTTGKKYWVDVKGMVIGK